jgi:cyclopropane fatty-acyl-phospholipid synthase-like methyltransferase
MGLDLYASIEPMLGFESEIGALYDRHIELHREFGTRRLLDIGCGGGAFMRRALDTLSLERAYGIDLSATMVARARALGLEADCLDIGEVEGSFDGASAVFDVLNYLDKAALRRFLEEVKRVLEPGGCLTADINTYFGFEAVAQGSLVRRDDTRFVALDSEFDGTRMETAIDLFEHENTGCWRRRSDRIVQYFHDLTDLADLSPLPIVQVEPLYLYDDEEPDKLLLVFRHP